MRRERTIVAVVLGVVVAPIHGSDPNRCRDCPPSNLIEPMPADAAEDSFGAMKERGRALTAHRENG